MGAKPDLAFTPAVGEHARQRLADHAAELGHLLRRVADVAKDGTGQVGKHRIEPRFVRQREREREPGGSGIRHSARL